jgi:ribosomal protein S18 acetylase RimI-like enzyme
MSHKAANGSMLESRVVRLTESESERAGAVLARAFRDDPFHVYFLPDAEIRDRLLPAFYTTLVVYGCLYGETWGVAPAPGGELAAVAIWLPMPAADFTPERMERSGMAGIPDLLGADAWELFVETAATIGAVQDQVVPVPHWDLTVVGVDPSWQQQGLGRILVQRFMARAAADGVPACFWTVQPVNVPFYQRHGFAVVAEGVEPKSGLHYWIFRRFADGP